MKNGSFFVPAESASNHWLEVLQSLIFWVIALIAMGYVIWGYLRDRPQITASLRKFKPIQWMITLLRQIALIFERLSKKVSEAIPQIVKLFGQRTAKRMLSIRKQRGTSQRDRVFTNYLRTLDIAKEEGLARKQTQTPYEYNKILEPKLIDSSDHMKRLTDTFMEARYSRHHLDSENVNQADSDAKSVQDTLRSLKDKQDGFEIS